MSYSVSATPRFKKEIKRLAKKYRSLKQEYIDLIESLEQNPEQGIELGNNCYKIRLAIKSKNKGKSGGSRVVTCVRIEHDTVYLLTIFDKADRENISDRELENLVEQIPEKPQTED